MTTSIDAAQLGLEFTRAICRLGRLLELLVCGTLPAAIPPDETDNGHKGEDNDNDGHGHDDSVARVLRRDDDCIWRAGNRFTIQRDVHGILSNLGGK